MIELKELIDIITRSRMKSIEVIGNTCDKSSKLVQFYELLAQDKVQTDEEAFEALYTAKGDKNAYYQLKHSLRRRLFNTMFFIDPNSDQYGEIKKGAIQCQKLLMLCNLLLMKNGMRNVAKLAKKGLKIALKFELTQEIVFLAGKLRMHYATMIGDRKTFKYYDALVNEYSELFLAEAKAKSKFYDLTSLYVNNKSSKEYVNNTAKKYIETLNEIKLPRSSINFFYYKAMIEIIFHMNQADYLTTLKLCRSALKKVESYAYLNTNAQLTISLQYIDCCIHLKLYDQGRAIIQKFLPKVEEGAYNWFKLQELHLTLCLHTKNYEQAWRTYLSATKHRKFKTLFANAQEVWKIYEAWLTFLTRAGKVDPFKGGGRRKFRLAKFINEVPTFSKDKRGLNVPILIVQIVFLLQEGKCDRLIDRMEAIAQYKHRYLNKEQNYRSNVFIRMLMEISKANFEEEKALHRTYKYRKMLNEAPLEVSNQSRDLEILPYEDIWEIVVEQLK